MAKPLPSDQVIKATAEIFRREVGKKDNANHTAAIEKIARLLRAAAELKTLGL